MAYIGRGIDNISNASILDVITFTDSAGPYNLEQGSAAFTPISAQALVISVDGVVQSPSSYTISAATITFDSVMAASSTNNFIVHNGVGLVTEPSDGSVTTAKIEDLAVTAGKLAATQDLSTKTITLPASVSGLGTGIDVTSQITGTIPTANLGSGTASSSTFLRGDQTYAVVTTYTDDLPTFTSVTPSTVTNDLTSVVIVGTNFGGSGIPTVEFQNSTGVITAASSVTRDSTTQLTVGVTLPTDGTYFIRIELNSGLAVRTTNTELTVSDAPVWTTGAGSLGTIAGDFSGTVATVAATGDTVAYSETTSVLTNASLANCSLNSSTGVITTSDFGGSSTSPTTYTFTLRATDAQAQTSDREFTLTSSFGATGGGQFN